MFAFIFFGSPWYLVANDDNPPLHTHRDAQLLFQSKIDIKGHEYQLINITTFLVMLYLENIDSFMGSTKYHS